LQQPTSPFPCATLIGQHWPLSRCALRSIDETASNAKVSGKVILLTGATGTGKSTLAQLLVQRISPLRRVDYGQLLREYKEQKHGTRTSYDELRAKSADVIAADDVVSVDDWLITQLPKWQADGHVLIDSHPVTKESFGYRVTPFSYDQLRRINFAAIFVLVGDPIKLAARICQWRALNPWEIMSSWLSFRSVL
jgi:adenylate kinase